MSVHRASTGPVRATFEERLGFVPDEFQRRAFDGIDAGRSVLVAAPTGSGKTAVAEYAIVRALAAGLKAFYTTPIKALSNQKLHDLRREHGRDRVGLLTGDNVVNPEAPIVVMTTEVLRNMIYEDSATLERLGVVVLDEVHYLQDPYRGAVWEEVIVHLERSVRFVCLSATVSNAEEFGDWLASVRGDTDVVIEERRPVDLEHRYVVALKGRDDLMMFPTFVEERGGRVPNPEAPRYDPRGPARRGRRPPPRKRRHGPRPVTPRRPDVVELLAEREMLPAIEFIFSRAACDDAVRQCLAAGMHLTTGRERDRIREIADRHCSALSDEERDALGFARWVRGLEAGIAAHHAGMVPPMKEAVEEAFTAGLIRIVYATETLSLGINMPARSVVIERLSKFTGERHENLTPGEYTQLTGRAGRRGIDTVGYAVVLWNRFAVFDQIAGLASKRTYELRSSFRPTYNMAANLVQRYEREEAHHLLNLSFAQYQADREIVAHERRIEAAREDVEALERRVACQRGDPVEYLELREATASARRAERGQAAREAALADLRPGDVVHAGGKIGRVVVLRRGGGRGPHKVTALSERGKTVRLGPGSFREPPSPEAQIHLPEPYAPKNPGFRREAAARLRRARGGGGRARRRRSDDGETTRLEASLEAHPVHACPARDEHLEALTRLRRAERRLRGLERRAARGPATLARRFEDVLGVLERWGYVSGWQLAPAGQVLRRLYSESDLLVSECLRRGLLDDLEPAEMAAAASLFSYEERGPRTARARVSWPTERLARRAHRIEDLWEELRRAESRAGLTETPAPERGFVETAHAWAQGETLDDVLLEEEMSGGDFVRNMKQLVDLLQQISEAADSASVARRARQAADALFRGVVEVSSRVGT